MRPRFVTILAAVCALALPTESALACYDVRMKGEIFHIGVENDRSGDKLMLFLLRHGCPVAVKADDFVMAIWDPCDPSSGVTTDENEFWDEIEEETTVNVGTSKKPGQFPGTTIQGGVTTQPGDTWTHNQGTSPGNVGTSPGTTATTPENQPTQPIGTTGTPTQNPAPSTGTPNIIPLEDLPVPGNAGTSNPSLGTEIHNIHLP